VLYTVDLRPVIIAEGQVPAFRDLSGLQAETQLQTVLVSWVLSISGVFGSETEAALKLANISGVEANRVVGRGEIIFVSDLPARVALE